jgi:glucans biosynthesis protein
MATREDGGTHEESRRFVVDFAGKKLKALRPDTILQGVVTVGAGDGEQGELLDQVVVRNPVDGSWRLSFQVRPKSRGPVELRAFLKQGNEALTETWSYVLEP